MKDICRECPDFRKIPDICVKMTRRVNDEEGGTKKLVMEVLQAMWLHPVRHKPQIESSSLMRKVLNIMDVVVARKDTGLDWLEQLLLSMFRPKENVKIILHHDKPVVAACLSWLGSVVNHVTRNFKLIRHCFRKYFGPLTERDHENPKLLQQNPFFRRTQFTVGLLLRHFDFTNEEVCYSIFI